MDKDVVSKDDGVYLAGKLIGSTEEFNLYKCDLPGKKVGILKIAASTAQNGILDREAYILQTMREEATQLEELYVAEKGPDRALNYQICFPNLVDSFVATDQGNRRINILKFSHVDDDLSRLVPIMHLYSRENVRVDPRTSGWMLGKLLKILVFTQGQGISIGRLTGDNILIERDQHFVAIFDWSKAMSLPGGRLPEDVAREEISQVAKEVILTLGGNPDTGELPPDPQLEDDRYAKHLYSLACGHESDAVKAHKEFYKLIRSIWPREFWPFTTYSLERS